MHCSCKNSFCWQHFSSYRRKCCQQFYVVIWRVLLRSKVNILCNIAECRTISHAYYYRLSIIESPLFTKLWTDYWSEEERAEFCTYLASKPNAGDLIPASGGCRKIRWSAGSFGKRGGVRVIYSTHLTNGAIVLLVIYGKNATENIPAHILKKIAEEFNYVSK